jgi:hypothetical protein
MLVAAHLSTTKTHISTTLFSGYTPKNYLFLCMLEPEGKGKEGMKPNLTSA